MNDLKEFHNETDYTIVNKAINLLNITYITHRYLKSSENTTIILLNETYLIKQAPLENLENTDKFLLANRGYKYQIVLYVDPEHKYIIFKYKIGTMMKHLTRPPILDDAFFEKILILARFNANADFMYGYGSINHPIETWTKFLQNEIKNVSPKIKKFIPDDTIPIKCACKLDKFKFTKKFIHGDFGYHNFVYKNKKFVGAISPKPILGDYLYDYLSAIVSHPQYLNQFTFEDIVRLCNLKTPKVRGTFYEPKEKVYYLLIIVLYCRIAKYLNTKKTNIDLYMKYWNYITTYDI